MRQDGWKERGRDGAGVGWRGLGGGASGVGGLGEEWGMGVCVDTALGPPLPSLCPVVLNLHWALRSSLCLPGNRLLCRDSGRGVRKFWAEGGCPEHKSPDLPLQSRLSLRAYHSSPAQVPHHTKKVS